MEFKDAKRYFRDQIARSSISTPEEVIKAKFHTGAPEYLVKKWVSEFYKTPSISSLPRSHRLVNHFMVGADPEFTFATPMTSKFVHASNFQLHVGLAFGADLAGRPVELRPAPSRFILEVIASILSELRWLALTVPSTREYSWVSKPYVERDGIGGHAHLGRKRMDARPKEVEALDNLTRLLSLAEVFNPTHLKSRKDLSGYGGIGDVRDQAHGFEYRTFPTWLDSPWLAYLTLVLTKLVVYSPDIISPVISHPEKSIRNILAYYKGLDDDALIAFTALERMGLPKQVCGDFKADWGLNYSITTKTSVNIIPEVIHPTEADRQAIFDYLIKGTALSADVPVPSWHPSKLPEGFLNANHSTATVQVKGMGELTAGLVMSEAFPIRFISDGNGLRIVTTLPILATKATVEKFFGPEIRFSVTKALDTTTSVYVGLDLRNENKSIKKLREFILQFLPIWEASKLTPEFVAKFQPKTELNLRGTLLEVS